MITTVAGGGTPSAVHLDGVGAPALSADLDPLAVAVDAGGNLYIVEDNRIEKVSNGVITTIAGGADLGFSGDNGPATSALLNGPTGIAVDSAGNVYVADAGNNRIWVLTPSGPRPHRAAPAPAPLTVSAAVSDMLMPMNTRALPLMLLATAAVLPLASAQTPPPAPKSARLYVFDCGTIKGLSPALFNF